MNVNYVTFSSLTTPPPPPSNQAPTVSLTAPSNNATYTAGATVTLSANASDADGTISKVEFYNGSTLLGTDNTAPYSFAWANVGAGSYSLTAKAFDNAGATKTSTAVSITVNPVSSGCNTAAWSASAVYTGGMRASKSGTIYEAKWWTQGNDPLTNSGQWDVWKVIGPCNAKIGLSASVPQESQNVVSLTPNPTNGRMQLTLLTNDAETADVQVFDFKGEQVYSKNGLVDGEWIDCQSLAQGIYYLKISIEGQQFSSRMVKQ